MLLSKNLSKYKFRTEGGDFKTFEEIVESEVEKRIEERMTVDEGNTYTFKTNDRHDFMYAFHGLDFLMCLDDLDNELRRQLNWNIELSGEQIKAYQEILETLHEIMRNRNVHLDMLY